jgi:hypothetical protein
MATSICLSEVESIPGRYGIDPSSMLLKNDGRGHFTDVTSSAAPGLNQIGMVTDAAWTDVTGDGRPDLVIVGEWMPIVIYRNKGGGKLERMDARGLEKSNGWWNRIVAGDFNGDGRTGFRSRQSRAEYSLARDGERAVDDVRRRLRLERVLRSARVLLQQRARLPAVLRDDLLAALPSLKARYPTTRATLTRRWKTFSRPESCLMQ